MNELEQMLKDTEVAKAFGLSRSSVWRLSKIGKLPAPVKVGLNAARWRKSEIKEWLEKA